MVSARNRQFDLPESKEVFALNLILSLLMKTCICDCGNTGMYPGVGIGIQCAAQGRDINAGMEDGGAGEWASMGPESSEIIFLGGLPYFLLRNATVLLE